MPQKNFIITDTQGIHARPATALVNTANKFTSELFIEYKGKKVNLKSIMGVMSLAITQGAEIVVAAEGEDSNEALSAIEEAIKDGLGELSH